MKISFWRTFAFCLALVCGTYEMAAAQGQSPGLKIEGSVAFTEGPAWHAATGNVYFTDITNNRIMRMDPKGQLHVYRTPSGMANGLAFDDKGRLYACEGDGEGGGLRVTRTELDGSITVLAERFQGKRFNAPNDLAIDSKGRVYFTDPCYGNRKLMEQFDADGKEIEGVYRIDTDGKIERLIVHEVDRPNGIGFSPDEKFIYIADNVNNGPKNGVGGNRKLWRFDVKADGTFDLASRKLLFDWGTERGPDGLVVGKSGLIYVAAGFNFPSLPAETADKYKSGAYVFSPEGKLLDFVPVPEDMCTNCTLGGKDLRTLYITSGHKLWSVKLDEKGMPIKK